MFAGVVVGYVFAAILGKVSWDAVDKADWIGFPDITTPSFNGKAIVLIVPAVILVLLAENAGHVKAVASMTEQDLDPMIGRSFMGDGVATTVSGLFGGSGTTTYAENIGVMGFTRVYSTLAYLIAGGVAILLGLLPKFGAIISAIPVGVLGGAVTVLFGMIAVLGGRIWVEARVDFRDPVNLVTAAVALIVGAGNYTLNWGDYQFAGIALGSLAAIGIYQILRAFSPDLEPRSPEEGGAFGDPLAGPLARRRIPAALDTRLHRDLHISPAAPSARPGVAAGGRRRTRPGPRPGRCRAPRGARTRRRQPLAARRSSCTAARGPR